MAESEIACEVAYARPDQQFVYRVTLPTGATAYDALTRALQSGLQAMCREIEPQSVVLGIFGKVVPPEQALSNGDRVEIYRPLAADPRIARRTRVKASR